MNRAMISIRGVSKRYRLGTVGMTSLRDEVQQLFRRNNRATASDFWALKDVTFDVQPGEALGVIGRNGAGKSTLLKLISRITEPTQGEMCLRGRVGSLLEVGTGFHPELSGRDNIFLNGAILGMSRSEIQSKFDEIVDFSEVSQFLDTPVKRYSSGMYVKLAFAIAAHLEPEILIVDEVLAVGDAAFQRKCLEKMQRICSDDGRTILFVSHSMPTIRRLCRRCVLLEKGMTEGIISTDAAVDRYSKTGAPSDLDLDLGERQRDWGTDGAVARILRVAVPMREHLRFNCTFDVEMTLWAERPLKEIGVSLSFNTMDGQRILTLDSDSGGKTFDLPRGQTVVKLALDRLPLHPGRYYVGAGICDRDHFLDIVDSFAVWEVETSLEDFESSRGFGGCRISPKVTTVHNGSIA